MTAERCEKCRYADDQGRNDWRCRRRAPVADLEGGKQRGIPGIARYPAINADDWCGDFERAGRVQ
jgi:hypothetical protein